MSIEVVQITERDRARIAEVIHRTRRIRRWLALAWLLCPIAMLELDGWVEGFSDNPSPIKDMPFGHLSMVAVFTVAFGYVMWAAGCRRRFLEGALLGGVKHRLSGVVEEWPESWVDGVNGNCAAIVDGHKLVVPCHWKKEHPVGSRLSVEYLDEPSKAVLGQNVMQVNGVEHKLKMSD